MPRSLYVGLVLIILLANIGCSSLQASGPKNSPSSTPEEEFQVNYRLYSPMPADHPYTVAAQRFADLIQQRTNGRIKIKIYPDSKLASGEIEALQGLQTGTIDLYVGSTDKVGSVAQSFYILDLPYLFRDNEHVDKVLDGPVGQSILGDLDRTGIKGLALWGSESRNLTNSVRTVTKPSDVSKLKLRTLENNIDEDLWRSLGGNLLPMPWSQVYSALQQHTFDGQDSTVSEFYSAKLFEVQKYLTLTHHSYSAALIAMSERSFLQMPQDDQLLFTKTAAELTSYERQLEHDQETKQINDLKKKGVQIVDNVDTSAWQAATKPVFDKYVTYFGNAVQEIINTN